MKKKNRGVPKMENPPKKPKGEYYQNMSRAFLDLNNQSLDQLPANDLFQDNMDSKSDLGVDNSSSDSSSIDFGGGDSGGGGASGDY